MNLSNEQKSFVERILLKFPFVLWDRFNRPSSNQMNVFGWIRRVDTHEDFIILSIDFEPKSIWFFTSSAEYSPRISGILNQADSHFDCQRIEHTFSIKNMVKL